MNDINAEWMTFMGKQSSDSMIPAFHMDLHAGESSKPKPKKKPVLAPKAPVRSLALPLPIATAMDSDEDNPDGGDDAADEPVDGEPVEEGVEVLDGTPPPSAKIALKDMDLYISTKTKVLFLNQEINIRKVFWEIPITEYWRPVECVVKKQMKIVSKTAEEYEELVEKLKTVPYYVEHVIKQINNPTARRIKFKDERKITVGISKKDIMNCRSKVKNAFYNCFAMIMRFKYEGVFREIHVKVFNTGKLEIPGILNSDILDIVKTQILNAIQPYVESSLEFVENTIDENVLINSNFNCGFFINREKLHAILRSDKYGIETAYDPCIYPGIKCKYYFNNEAGFDHAIQTGRIEEADRRMKMSELGDNKKYREVSFMVFRTGSCLIVGNCSEKILRFIFEFIKTMLMQEEHLISVANDQPSSKGKKPKLRKKNVNISDNYFNHSVMNASMPRLPSPSRRI
jgi:hypothetical protein